MAQGSGDLSTGRQLLSEALPTAQQAVQSFQVKRSEPLTNTFLNFVAADEDAPRMRRCRSAEFGAAAAATGSGSADFARAPSTPASDASASECGCDSASSDDDGTCSTGSCRTGVSSEQSQMCDGWQSPRSCATTSEAHGMPEEAARLVKDAKEEHITTVTLQNLPRIMTRESLMEVLHENGVGTALYDFLHVPFSFSTGMCLGYGFINFKSPAAAQEFSRNWNGTDIFTRFSQRQRNLLPLVVEPARVQGLSDLLEQRGMKKFLSVRTAALRPYIEVPSSTGGEGDAQSPAASSADTRLRLP